MSASDIKKTTQYNIFKDQIPLWENKRTSNVSFYANYADIADL